MSPQTILFLASNPRDKSRLQLDRELRDIAEGLQRSQKREQFVLEQRWAVQPRDIQRAILDVNPKIIHFSGHGLDGEGLVFQNEIGNTRLVDGDALAGLFKLFSDQIQCVVLNGCYSKAQAHVIAQHISYVVGMDQSIGDRAAIAFAVGFYDALGAGRNVEFAHQLGCAAIRMEGLDEYLVPELVQRTITNSSAIESTQFQMADEQSAVTPSPSVDFQQYEKRATLFQFLSSLPITQFEQIIFTLKPLSGNVPSASAPPGQRVSALLEWAESPIGCSLEVVEQILNSIVSPH